VIQVGRIETWVIEQVEDVGFVFQIEALVDFEILLQRKIKSVLERPAEQVSTIVTESRLKRIARCCAHCR
jgi:hypothetical protein